MKKIVMGLLLISSFCLQAQKEKNELESQAKEQQSKVSNVKKSKVKKASTLRVYTIFEHKQNWNTIEDIFDDLAVKAGIRINRAQPFGQINSRLNRNVTVIVDGVQYDLSILNSLNPKDIEKIEILRGAISNNQATLRN